MGSRFESTTGIRHGNISMFFQKYIINDFDIKSRCYHILTVPCSLAQILSTCTGRFNVCFIPPVIFSKMPKISRFTPIYIYNLCTVITQANYCMKKMTAIYIFLLIICMKDFLDSDWLREQCNFTEI